MKGFLINFMFCAMVYLIWRGHVDRLPATQEQLLILSRDTPCVQDAFRKALNPDGDHHPEPLTIGDARKLAGNCRDKAALPENEKQVTLNEQRKALSDKE